MADAEIVIAAPPERVFDVLADGRLYGHWVVGSRAIRAVDADWPRPGSRLHHSVGIGPLNIRDHTLVEEADPPRRLRLRARARPVLTAIVEIVLEPHGSGTRVRMDEDGADPVSRMFFNPLSAPLVHVRNEASLKRLRDLAEGHGPSPEQARTP